MISRSIATFGLVAIFLAGNTLSMDDNNKSLIIGCRPWDDNMREFNGLNTVHFVDRMLDYIGKPPETLPSNFHHLDIDNKGLFSSGNFCDFASSRLGQYQTIIIDWITYQHIRRDDAWSDFSNLLNTNGSLIVPVTYIEYQIQKNAYNYDITVHVPGSQKRAEEFINNKGLANLFSEVKILSYEDTLEDTRFDLLRRPNLGNGRLNDYVNTMKAVIIVATK